VRASFEQAFRAHGLPRAIRTDNGVPFATTGIHGLSQLNVWWMRLGIQHQRSRPATPQDNAAHERMHKTLKGARSYAVNGRTSTQAIRDVRVVLREVAWYRGITSRSATSRSDCADRAQHGEVSHTPKARDSRNRVAASAFSGSASANLQKTLPFISVHE